MTLLKVSASRQISEVEHQFVKVTRDQGGGWYVHGRGHFIFFKDLDAAERKRRDLELESGFGGRLL